MIIPSGRGMGAANCPSLAQLQGITDPTDPCQAINVTAAGGYTPVFSTTVAAPGCNGIVGWLQCNPMIAIAGAVVALLLIRGGGRR